MARSDFMVAEKVRETTKAAVVNQMKVRIKVAT